MQIVLAFLCLLLTANTRLRGGGGVGCKQMKPDQAQFGIEGPDQQMTRLNNLDVQIRLQGYVSEGAGTWQHTHLGFDYSIGF